MTGDVWSPRQYERFKDERSQPFRDLLALVQPCDKGRVVDLGCGTGELTRRLHQYLGASQTVGIDQSESMLAASGAFASEDVCFRREKIDAFVEAGWDVIFSNAALQWVPDHPALLERLSTLLRPAGQLAVQMPANHDHPSHLIAAEVAAQDPFRSALNGYQRRISVLPPEAYASLLDELGFLAQHVRLQVYGHHLTSREEVVEWVRGTLLTDYEVRLPPPVFEQFLTRYRERLMSALPDRRPYFYPFKRILMWARLG